MKINEIFYSLQGEGARTGEASIFVRLQGCDLACSFCDTEFESGKEMSIGELHTAIADSVKRVLPTSYAGVIARRGLWIVWTGGEPCLQLTEEIVTYFKNEGFKQAMETNGNHKPPAGLDWVCCSPKVADHVVKKNFPDGVDELRYVRHCGQPGVPIPSIQAKRLFLSPMFRGNNPDPENLRHCIKLCMENPQWSLSVQTHKLHKIL
jgi:7-carboxy-7-deazaguanine synthase